MKTRDLFYIFFIGNFLFGCGAVTAPPLTPLSERTLQVVSVWPEEGREGFNENYVEVTFDKPINAKTLTIEAFFVAPISDSFSLSEVNLDEVVETLSIQEGKFETLEEGRKVRFFPQTPFLAGARYAIVLTSHLLSFENIPFTQTPKEGPTPFFSTFKTMPISSQSEREGEAPSGFAGGGGFVSPSNRPSFLMLSEVFYDAVGSDTEGDLFIELYGEPQKDLSGHQILLVNGENGEILDALQIPQGLQTGADGFFVIADAATGSPGITHVANADWVANFDPQNGPDCLQLLDPEGGFIDALGYGSPLVLRAENNELCYEGEPALDVSNGLSLQRISLEENGHNNAIDWQTNETPNPGFH